MAISSGSRTAKALEVRSALVEALELDLVGPRAGHRLESERLPGWVRPSNWYMTGFLVPVEAPPQQSADEDADEELDGVPEEEGLPEESAEEGGPAKKGLFPSSIGLSMLVAAQAQRLEVTVRWGEYEYEAGDRVGDGGREDDEEIGDEGAGVAAPSPQQDETGDEEDSAGHRPPAWVRTQQRQTVTLSLAGASGMRPAVAVPGSAGLELELLVRDISAAALEGQMPAGTRSVSLFLVNRRKPDSERADRAYAFQAELEVSCEVPLIARSDVGGALSDEWDERVADLHYADVPEYATGHGVAADWDLEGGECRRLRTRWLPAAEVPATRPTEIEGVELRMRELGALQAEGVLQALGGLVEHYRQWIAQRRALVASLPERRRQTAEELLHLAGVAAERIERGVELLARDEDVLDAFRVANRSVARALERRLPEEDEPAWRAFQLAFILLNLPSLADPRDPNRQTVDLLYFPTGGGKTEAYLGLAAFAIVLRRLRQPGQEGRAGAGVSVVMRYTLRLLTLDQLQRAAALVCALELEREADPGRYGAWPIEIGLWVGKAATPNLMGRRGDKRQDNARIKVRQFKSDPRHRPSPIPLEQCPWCGTRFAADSFTLDPDDDHPRQLRIVCTNLDCAFIGDRALPIVAVDEQLYRRLPAFLIATVDKFATLPWVGLSGTLLGGAERFDADGFYGAAEPSCGTPLHRPLAPPDLVIQDELHLISGPLGTMAGLYETAIDALCSRTLDDRPGGPKIVASTATVRRAQDQIQALFGRAITQIFPPPGPDRRDSFFARTLEPDQAAARLYLGAAAQGRNPKVWMRRVWLALMGAAERCYREHGGHRKAENPADPYMTIVGYFNSLRELGGARRILEEEVRSTIKAYGGRRRLGEQEPLFQDRTTFSEVLELTSRVPTNRVAEARRRLGQSFDQPDRVDCAIATNMIAVGLDIPRLALMGVLGQPKSAAEYIQATSRVGRAEWAPGLVVTILNMNRPRDRSHYERFRHFHETFYRAIEVASVTPFAARALDRGLVGAMLTAARHLQPALTPALGAGEIAKARAALERRLIEVFAERVCQQPLADEGERGELHARVRERIADLLDSWVKIAEDCARDDVKLRYQSHEGPSTHTKPLMHEVLEASFESEHHRKFRVGRSLRDVEPAVNLFLRDLGGGSVEEPER